MKKAELIPLIREVGIGAENLIDTLVQFIVNKENISTSDELRQNLRLFIEKVKTFLKENNRYYDRFLSKKSLWLEGDIC